MPGSVPAVIRQRGDVGPPYPLALEGGDATASLDLTFSRYGAKVDLTAPPRTEVVDLADLKR